MLIFLFAIQLNSKSQFENAKELADTILTLRLLAKYLGFLVFLPYQNVPTTFSSEKRTQVNEIDDNRVQRPLVQCLMLLVLQMEPYDILQCVKDCCDDGTNLVITVPWVVEFCAMMDSQALTIPYYRELLTCLIGIYR